LVGLEERLESDGVPKPKECADTDALGEEKGPSVASEGLLVWGSAVAVAGADAEGKGAGIVKRASSSSSLRSNEVRTGFLADLGVVGLASSAGIPSSLEDSRDDSLWFDGGDILCCVLLCSSHSHSLLELSLLYTLSTTTRRRSSRPLVSYNRSAPLLWT
jgi:hypothetical protein